MCNCPQHSPPLDAQVAGMTKWTCSLCGEVTTMGAKGVQSYDRPTTSRPSGSGLNRDSFAPDLPHAILASGVCNETMMKMQIDLPIFPQWTGGSG